MDWLFMLDVDEFPVVENRSQFFCRQRSARERCNLLTMLAGIPLSRTVVRFPVSELLPARCTPGTPFWQQHHFLRKLDFQRSALDPSDDEVKHWSGNVGHSFGKCIVRTTADVQAFDPHFWTHDQGKHYPLRPGFSRLPQKCVGKLLHFVTVDHRQWREKYEKLSHEPACWREGSGVSFPKQCWKEAAGRMSEAESREYYRTWVASSPNELAELTRLRIAEKDDIVRRVLTECGALDGAQVSIPDADGCCQKKTLCLPVSARGPAAELGIERSANAIRCKVAELAEDCLDGFRQTIYDGRQCYRWAADHARLRLRLAPHDYLMTIRLAAGIPCRRPVAVQLAGRPVPSRSWPRDKERICLFLTRGDFASGDLHTISLAFLPRSAHDRTGQTSKAAAVTEIVFERLGSERAAA
jgi:hypothetical protein